VPVRVSYHRLKSNRPRKLSYPRANVASMKIYRVNVTSTLDGSLAETKFFTTWSSARNSAGHWGAQYQRHGKAYDVTIEAAQVPEDQWKATDPVTESRLSQVTALWEQLTAADPDSVDALLDALVKRVAPKKPAAVLATDEKREAEAMLKLNRLVDAA